ARATATSSRAGSRSTPATPTGAAAGVTTGVVGTTATTATTQAPSSAGCVTARSSTSTTAGSAVSGNPFRTAGGPGAARLPVQPVASLADLGALSQGARRAPSGGHRWS